jgi:hypothetical protein
LFLNFCLSFANISSILQALKKVLADKVQHVHETADSDVCMIWKAAKFNHIRSTVVCTASDELLLFPFGTV